MGAERDESRLHVSCRSDGALGCAKLSRERRGALEEELLALCDARSVRFTIDQLTVELCAKDVHLYPGSRFDFCGTARIGEGSGVDVVDDGMQSGLGRELVAGKYLLKVLCV